MYGFNLALLGKQCWNFLSNPNSLVARIYKARYFANTHLFDASRGGGVSFIWSGLWQAKEALKKGFKWVLGDGEDIRIFEDPWVRGKENYMVDNTYTGIASGTKVCELFIPGEKQWDISKVHNLVTNYDAKIFLAIPIPRNQVPDRIAWNFTNDGKYSVKSGYKFWHDQNSERQRVPCSPGWVKLWKLAIPHKFRVFLWRICRSNLPVRYQLRGKGVQTAIICPLCLNDIEHLLHIFLDCSFAKRCWNLLGLEFDTSSAESCSEWLLQRLAEEDGEKMVQVAIVLWGIWSARNMLVWENKKVTPENAMQWSINQVRQWQEVQVVRSSNDVIGMPSHRPELALWNAPATGKLKVNVDASVVSGASSFAIGMVLRDHLGGFCNARNLRREGEISVFEAEAYGVLEAIRWVHDLGISNVEIESDSLLTVQAILQGTTNYHEVGNLLYESRILISDRPDISIAFIKKQANKVAHMLARVPCEVNCSNVFPSPPQLVLESIMYDALMS